MNDQELLFAVVVLAALEVLLLPLMWVLPPLPVLVRKARPYASIAGIAIWLAYRLYGGSYSLWHVIAESLASVSQFAIVHSRTLHLLWTLLLDGMAILLLASLSRVVYCLFHFSRKEWQDWLVQSLFDWAKENVGVVQKEINKSKDKTRHDVEKMLGKDPNRIVRHHLPDKGVPTKSLIKQFRFNGEMENDTWKRGKVSGTVYPADGEHTALMNAAYAAFSWSNPLHAGIWPSVNQYEAEIIAMTANLMVREAKHSIVGTTTSGGTESIILAIKAHKIYYGNQRFIRHPELICGPTAHASVDKACEMMGIRQVVVPCDPKTHTLVPHEVAKHITSNTIMIFASAPTYPQGVIDPIEELSEIAVRYDIGLHVDACLGGFVLPFAKQMGYDIPNFDFEIPGVTSMSVDTHKYAYATKGTSVVLYRHEVRDKCISCN